MRVEAIKVEDGFLIPFNETFEKNGQDKILLEVEIVDRQKMEEGYALLDEMVGLYESDRSDAALHARFREFAESYEELAIPVKNLREILDKEMGECSLSRELRRLRDEE